MSVFKRIIRISVRFLYTLYFHLVFIVFCFSFYTYGVLVGTKSPRLWRLLARKAVDGIFFLTAIRPKVTGLENLPSGKKILIANHQSLMDGFIILSVTNILFTAITAPFGHFPSFIQKWFVRMGYIQIPRDEYEEIHYDHLTARNKVVEKSLVELERGGTILIFPEGKRETTRRMLPFYKGAAEMAFRSKAPIVPIILKNLDHLFPFKKKLMIPSRIEVIIEKPLHLETHFENPIAATEHMEKIIEWKLPERYRIQDSLEFDPSKKRAVFFDLDGTLTPRNISSLILERHLISHPEMKTLFLSAKFLFKKIFLKHGIFYRQALRLLKGISVAEIQKELSLYLKTHKEEFFYPEMLELIELHKNRGDLLFIITEEPRELVLPLEKSLNVEIAGTSAEIQNGFFTGKIIGTIMKGPHKERAVREIAQKYHIDLERSFAYGNAWQDDEMLHSVGHGTLVNPSRSLATHAGNVGFRVIY